ncbi:hypothetical protein ACH436_01550 [Isoptericola sp. NPDC019693]|uniref:hypothetical protein n=1 Tax=Isoptericola sp. NPDC019693 TaxID=3364009 RepID=UPI0037BC4FC3
MNEYLYYDEFRARQADLEQAVRWADARAAARQARRTSRRAATRRRRAPRRPWELPAGLVRPWPQ